MKFETEKSYNAILEESYNYFGAQGVSIIGEGYKEIATNQALFESYVESLTAGASANSAATMAQLMANTNAGLLHESSITGIQPIASLSMPVIRKLWPKFALKDALKTEVAKSPRFVVAYTKPYMVKGDGDKVYLPNGLRNGGDAAVFGDSLTAAGKKTYVDFAATTVAAGAAVTVDKSADSAITLASSTSLAKKQPCDELWITEVKAGADADHLAAVKTFNTRLSVVDTKVIDVNATGAAGQIFVKFDKVGKVVLAYIGTGIVTVAGKIGVSSEYNEDSYTVGYDIKRQDIDIPTGQHINAALPIEALNDAMALYQIDGTKETVDIMTNIFAQKLDLEVIDFIQGSFANQPGNEAFAGNSGYSEFSATFNCNPAAGFAGSPKAWREELKPMIDFIATKIKNATYLQAGIFTIVGNPLDINLISNVDWSFRAGQGNSMDGVDVDYSTGTYVGANAYRVIASVNVPAGALYIVFTPSTDTQMTYKYYPYTFSTEMGYTDPNRSRVPSVMMTKRHTFHEFMPACGCIIVANNTGSPYNQFGTAPYASLPNA